MEALIIKDPRFGVHKGLGADNAEGINKQKKYIGATKRARGAKDRCGADLLLFCGFGLF